MAQCAGRRIATIEHVAALPGARALVERMVLLGGIQCGACTPGVVVTAWALKERNPSASREEIREALAGNLCRCTGYEGILRALLPDEADDGGGA
jgi:aerobic-type carbon monoxide dehydrogenase small subunit (CoxS/CutS family)